MQHAVGHVTLLGWLWIWKGQLRCSWYQSQQTLRHSSQCKLLVRRMAPEGKALASATTPGPSLRLGALFPKLDAFDAFHAPNCLNALHRVDDATQHYAALIGNRD